jgi:hypothetical protein
VLPDAALPPVVPALADPELLVLLQAAAETTIAAAAMNMKGVLLLIWARSISLQRAISGRLGIGTLACVDNAL